MNWYVHKFPVQRIHKKRLRDWKNIDRTKDKSLAANEFEFYLYNRIV